MSRRRSIDRYRRGLDEIAGIMNSMKTLAYLETRKLSRLVDAQHAVVGNLEQAARDLLAHHPGLLPPVAGDDGIIIAIGSERGFCGDFNHALVELVDDMMSHGKNASRVLIAVGQKLHDLIDDDRGPTVCINGAGASEEISGVLDQLVDRVSQWQQAGICRVSCLYHAPEGVVGHALLPPFQHLETAGARQRLSPLLNLSPNDFLVELADHYLFVALHAMLYVSLMAENHRRVDHLDHAVNYLGGRINLLAQKYNQLRQEEIIEEIEVLLLYADASSIGPRDPGNAYPGH
jgi:F-type H+-transporting ATPase subunit gamma